MATVTVSTDDLMQEVAELSQRLTDLKPGVSAEPTCQKCWYPATAHRNNTVKGCKRKDKMEIEQFTRRLLEQRNNLVEMIKAAKGEQADEQELEQLRATVKHQNKEMEAARERIKSLVATREVLQQLMRSANNAYRVFSTGGTVEEMRKVFEHLDELMADMNVDTKSQSSSGTEDDDDDDGGGTDDPGGTWDHTAELTWPTGRNIGPINVDAQYPSSGHLGTTSTHGESAQKSNNAGKAPSGGDDGSTRKKTVTFALYPPTLRSNDGQSSDSSTRSVFDIPGSNPIRVTAPAAPAAPSAPSYSSILSNPPPVPPMRPRVPGYKDYPGVMLLHERGGTMAGGTPDGDKVIKGTKLVKTVI